MDKNKLREIKDGEMDKVIKKIEKYLPDSLAIYNFLLIGFGRKLVDAEFTKVFIPDDDDCPCFVLITGVSKKVNRNSINAFWNPDEISNERAKTLLKSLPNWNWESPIFLRSVSMRTILAIEEILFGDDGIVKSTLLPAYTVKAFTFTYKSEDFTYSYNLPEDMFLAPLTENDATLVHKNWIYNFGNSIEGIQGEVKNMPSFAAYAKTTGKNSNTEDGSGDEETKSYHPVSWAICKLNGEIGYTFTFPEFRNMGLSSAVTYELTKKILAMNITPFVNISENNKAAIKFHEKIGYRKCYLTMYRVYITENMTLQEF